MEIFNRALSASEMQAIYNAGSHGKCKTVALADSYSVNEDGTLVVPAPGVLANDTGLAGGPLAVVLTSGPTHGSVFLQPTGSFAYTPAPNFNGTQIFTYQANDGTNDSNNVRATIRVNPINDPPTLLKNLSLVVDEGTAATIDNTRLKVTDLDSAASQITYVVGAAPRNGTLKKAGAALGQGDSFTEGDIDAGLISYVHNGSETISDSFTFLVCDGSGGSIPSTTFSIIINPVNDPPVLAANSGLTLNEGATGTIDNSKLRVTDPDHPPAQLAYRVVTAPANGTLRKGTTALVAGDNFTQADVNGGLMTYLHNGSETTSDNFTFRVSDGAGATIPTATFNITVNPVNDPPTLDGISNPPVIDEDAANQTVNLTGISAGGGENQALTVTAISNNPGLIPNPTISYTSPAQAGSLSYRPVADQSGTATITVTVRDAGLDNLLGNADDGAVSRTFDVTVRAVNDPPTLNPIPNPTAIDEDAGTQTVAIAGISAGGGESQTLSVTATSSNTSLIPNPAVTYNSPGTTGALSYTPIANQSGTATITVTVRDAGLDGIAGNADDATLSRAFVVAVNAVNDPPDVRDDSYTVEQDGVLTVTAPGVLANDSDIEGDRLTVSLALGPTNGTVTLNSNGSFTYTAKAGFAGRDSFTYRASDGTLDSAVATVSIEILPLSSCRLVRNPVDTPLVCLGSQAPDQIQIELKGNLIVVKFVKPRPSLVATFPVDSLDRIIIRGLAGNDFIHVGSNIPKPAWIFGGPGNDHLHVRGGSFNNVLVGEDGNDTLEAGTDRLDGGLGRDLMIGGRGKDHLKASAGDNLLIAGFTDFDGAVTALEAVMAEWTRSNQDYRQRVDHLLMGGGLNGLIKLNPTSVHDDGDVDVLDGAPKPIWLDWFFANLDGDGDKRKKDTANGLNGGRIGTDIDIP